MTNHQREGSPSNSHVGKAFELKAKAFFEKRGMTLEENFSLQIGLTREKKKAHRFDLGDRSKKVIIECKSHTWTKGGNVPSAKMTTWNQAMFFFLTAPKAYRKILFVLKSVRGKANSSLAEYYVRIYGHLIPKGVEIWEFDEDIKNGERLESR